MSKILRDVMLPTAAAAGVLSILGMGLMGATPARAETVALTGDVTEFPDPDDGARFSDNCGFTAICEGGRESGNNMSVVAAILIGIEDRKQASVEMFKTFQVEDDAANDDDEDDDDTDDNNVNETLLDARIVGDVSWRGTLFAVGFQPPGDFSSSRASVFILASLVDVTPSLPNPIEAGNAEVFANECSPGDTGIEIPLTDIGLQACRVEELFSNSTFNFAAKVVTGHTYEIRLTTICKFDTGVFDFPIICSFSETDLDFGVPGFPGLNPIEDGFVRWNTFNIAIEENVVDGDDDD